MVEVSLTVGKLDASLAVLLTKDHHLIEFPTILLPLGVKGGLIVKIKCEHDIDTEIQEKKQFQQIQDEIYEMFGKNVPKAPILGVRNVTQTSCVLQWEPLDLGTASFKSLVLYRDDSKLFSVPNPLSNRTTKLSGLGIDKLFLFQLRLDTTAGVFMSDKIVVTTHKMTDLSGINVCVQDIGANEEFTIDDINQALKNMGAHSPAHDKMRVDTTHYITTRENKDNPEYVKACEMNVPIIRPEWLKQCERERRIVGVLNFYVKECALPNIMAEKYWADSLKSVSKLLPEPASNTVPSVHVTELSDTEAESKVNTKKEDTIEKPESSETKNTDEVADKEPEVAEKEPEVTEKEPEVTEKEPEVTEKEPKVTEKEPKVTEKEPKVTEKEPLQVETDKDQPKTEIDQGLEKEVPVDSTDAMQDDSKPVVVEESKDNNEIVAKESAESAEGLPKTQEIDESLSQSKTTDEHTDESLRLAENKTTGATDSQVEEQLSSGDKEEPPADDLETVDLNSL
ncbi:hypothetical protein PUMCH_003519 [Australozyma saopauloensis]|uniref:Chitin biosynthesis protein CHS5 n=1 Tax=Australozyma saopauloensis TaxID=291208 RepID=A0AAX4HCC6_9ASCO|nr:hypothetical protein PUMCH_003519 [[Candida] saopauloensis]